MSSEFSPKDPDERLLLTFNFANWLATGETIDLASIRVESIPEIGADPDAAAMIVGEASLTGTKALQMVGGGLVGVTYRLKCTAETSKGQKLVLNGRLPVAITYGNA